jgi:Xaa-Pro aminopeptidase
MSNVLKLAFSVEEYRSRLDQAQARMVARRLDALLVSNRADLCYLTGMESLHLLAHIVAIIPAAGDPILVASDSN